MRKLYTPTTVLPTTPTSVLLLHKYMTLTVLKVLLVPLNAYFSWEIAMLIHPLFVCLHVVEHHSKAGSRVRLSVSVLELMSEN